MITDDRSFFVHPAAGLNAPRVVAVTPPAEEPVTLAELKAHLRVDDSDQDTLLSGLLTAARRHIEELTGRAFVQTRLRAYWDLWPRLGTYYGAPLSREIELPRAPLLAAGAVPSNNYQAFEVTLDAGDESKAITFPTAFADVPVVTATLQAPDDGFAIALEVSDITALGCTVNLGGAVPATGYSLNIIAALEDPGVDDEGVTVESVKYLDENGDEQTLSPDDYTVEPGLDPNRFSRIRLNASADAPSLGDFPGALRVTFFAGYGTAADVPQEIKVAIKLVAGHWHTNPIPVNVGNIVNEIPMTAQHLIDHLRVRSIA